MLPQVQHELGREQNEPVGDDLQADRRSEMAIIYAMPTPEPNPPWYQFSLRSLLLFTLFVAVLCSIGVCTHWVVLLITGVGSVTGRIFAGREVGYVTGVMFGTVSGLITYSLAIPFGLLALAFVRNSGMPQWVLDVFAIVVVLLGVVLGGVFGGLAAGKPSGKLIMKD